MREEPLTLYLIANGLDEHGGAFEEFVEYLEKNAPNFKYLGIRNPISKEQLPKTYFFTNNNQYTKKRLFNKPPVSYLFDIFYIPKFKEPGIFISFNSLSTVFLWLRNRKKCTYFIQWSIDFVPRKFNSNFLNFIYKKIDIFAHSKLSEHWEVSEAALQARKSYLRSSKVTHKVVPIGIRPENFQEVNANRFARKEVVYFGTLDYRNGIDFLVKIIPKVLLLDNSVKFKIIGTGPLFEFARTALNSEIKSGSVEFFGFLKDTAIVSKILNNCTIAVAPYSSDETYFTYFADPGKLKAYVAAGLPIVTNEIPPNSSELKELAGAYILSKNASVMDYAKTISDALKDELNWYVKSNSAREYAEKFIWEKILYSNFFNRYM